MCFWGHDWNKWDEAVVVDGVDGKKYAMQSRTCKRCGKYQREARHDRQENV